MSGDSENDPLAGLPWPKPALPGADVTAAIRRRCTEDLGRRGGLSSAQRALASFAFSLAVVGLAVWLARKSGSHLGTLEAALVGAVGWGLVQAGVLWIGLVKPPGKRAPRGLRLTLAVVLPIAFLVYVALAAPGWLSFSEFSKGEHSTRALHCGLVGLLFSAIVSGGVLLLWRRTDPLSPGLTGALAGLVGGVGGGLAISIACPTAEGWHACFSHGLWVVAFAGLGWAVGRRLLSP